MADDIDWSRIARYLGGDCSEEERCALETKLAAEPAWREAVEAARHVWASTSPEADQWNVPAAWQAVVRKQAEMVPPAAARPPAPSPAALVLPWQRRRWWRASALWAAVVVGLVVGAGVWYRRPHPDGARVARAEAASMYTVTTRPSQRLEVRMSDGTRVILGVASTLRYPKTYGVSSRELYLDGEAYFDVVHDATKPMVVYAKNAVTRDLGTKFDVRAYADDGGVEVVVADGKVELGSATGPQTSAARAVLAPGQLGHVDGLGAVTTGQAADLAGRLAWIDGHLVFHDVALRDALPQLARWYDVDLRLADRGLGDRLLRGTFSNESVPAFLQILALSMNVRYEQDGRAYVLSPN